MAKERLTNERLNHPFAPLIDENCTVLILGSFPSRQSRAVDFYYGHPQNRFWKIMSALIDEEIPDDVNVKRELLLKHHIALWDIIHECTITGSSDSSIKDVVPNDIKALINHSSIRHIYCNGQTSGKLYKRYALKKTGIEATILPSSSPANARFSLARLIEEWGQMIDLS